MHRLRDLAVQGGNGALAQESRDALAVEVDQLIDHPHSRRHSKWEAYLLGDSHHGSALGKGMGADGRVSGVCIG